MSWSKIVKGALETTKKTAKKGASKAKPYADKAISAVKKHPYISTGAGIVGAGALADILTPDIEQEGEISPKQLEIAAQKLRELGYSEEDIAMYLEKATRHPSNFDPNSIDVTSGWATNNDADQEFARPVYLNKYNNNSLELLLQMQKNRNKGAE